MPRFLTPSLAALSALWMLLPSPASACSTGGGTNAVAYPPPGATGVSPGTTIFLASNSDALLAVLVDGAPLGGVTDVQLGLGFHDGDVNAEMFRRLVLPQASLPPGAHVEVRVQSDTDFGTAVVATSFDTATTSDGTAGTPPVISALRLWRQHYPKDQFGVGSCTPGIEVWPFLEADWTAAMIPATTAEGLVHVFTLVPQAGGMAQTFVLGGTAKMLGTSPLVNPQPISPGWHPQLDAGVEYCLTTQAFGDGDLSRPALVSNSTCALPLDVGDSGGSGGGGGAGGSGGSSGGNAGSATAGAAGNTTTGTGGNANAGMGGSANGGTGGNTTAGTGGNANAGTSSAGTAGTGGSPGSGAAAGTSGSAGHAGTSSGQGTGGSSPGGAASTGGAPSIGGAPGSAGSVAAGGTPPSSLATPTEDSTGGGGCTIGSTGSSTIPLLLGAALTALLRRKRGEARSKRTAL